MSTLFESAKAILVGVKSEPEQLHEKAVSIKTNGEAYTKIYLDKIKGVYEFSLHNVTNKWGINVSSDKLKSAEAKQALELASMLEKSPGAKKLVNDAAGKIQKIEHQLAQDLAKLADKGL